MNDIPEMLRYPIVPSQWLGIELSPVMVALAKTGVVDKPLCVAHGAFMKLASKLSAQTLAIDMIPAHDPSLSGSYHTIEWDDDGHPYDGYWSGDDGERSPEPSDDGF